MERAHVHSLLWNSRNAHKTEAELPNTFISFIYLSKNGETPARGARAHLLGRFFFSREFQTSGPMIKREFIRVWHKHTSAAAVGQKMIREVSEPLIQFRILMMGAEPTDYFSNYFYSFLIGV